MPSELELKAGVREEIDVIKTERLSRLNGHGPGERERAAAAAAACTFLVLYTAGAL